MLNELIAVAFLKVKPKNPYTIGMAIPPPPTPAIFAKAIKTPNMIVPIISSVDNGNKTLSFPSLSGYSSLVLSSPRNSIYF